LEDEPRPLSKSMVRYGSGSVKKSNYRAAEAQN